MTNHHSVFRINVDKYIRKASYDLLAGEGKDMFM